jgi:hypothetical protein
MGKGLLAWWRRRIVARGLAGAALFAVPVAVAALIGFGAGFSGVTGGLSSFTNGPDAVPAAAPTGPTKLNRAVVALASKQTGSDRAATGDGGGGASQVESTGSGTSTGSGSDGGSGGSGGGTDAAQVPTVSTPSTPQVSLPGSGSGGAVGGATDSLNGTVNNVIGGVNNTLNGLLGK